MKKKLPWMKWFSGDWLKDPNLTLCSSATRGVWADLISAMHEAGQTGKLTGTPDQLARLGRSSSAEIVHVLSELQATGTADVTQRNGVVTVVNRRMSREFKKKQGNATRQVRHRKEKLSRSCHTEVTGEMSDIRDQRSDCSPYGEQKKSDLFEAFWLAFPSGRKTKKGKARAAFDRALKKATAETIIAAAGEYASSPVGQGEFVQGPEPWLNGECWNDDRTAWNRSQSGSTGVPAIVASRYVDPSSPEGQAWRPE